MARERGGNVPFRGWLLAGTALPALAAAALGVGGRGSLPLPAGDRAGPAAEEPVRPRRSPLDLPGEIPPEARERVRRWIRFFVGPHRAQFETWLAREGRYGGYIRERLRERGMPLDLLYLAMIESGFSPWAYSRARASGLWQFLDGTARRYGLRVDDWVDERRDPVRATDAALDYLEALHRRFGSWYLAAAAYNGGENRVERILRSRAGGRRGEEGLYWEILEHLPRETREYVPRLIAAATVAKDPERFGLQVRRGKPYVYERVFVPGGTSLEEVAEAVGLPPGGLRALNPHLVRGVTPEGLPYPVRVPPGAAARVVASLGRGSPGTLVD